MNCYSFPHSTETYGLHYTSLFCLHCYTSDLLTWPRCCISYVEVSLDAGKTKAIILSRIIYGGDMRLGVEVWPNLEKELWPFCPGLFMEGDMRLGVEVWLDLEKELWPVL